VVAMNVQVVDPAAVESPGRMRMPNRSPALIRCGDPRRQRWVAGPGEAAHGGRLAGLEIYGRALTSIACY
jgi:hypothetical protein